MPEERYLWEKEETGMNLTYITWGYAWDQAIIAAFEQIGFTVEQVATKLSENDEKLFKKQWAEILEKDDPYYNKNLSLSVSGCNIR